MPPLHLPETREIAGHTIALELALWRSLEGVAEQERIRLEQLMELVIGRLEKQAQQQGRTLDLGAAIGPAARAFVSAYLCRQGEGGGVGEDEN